jgi:hypothetical protein
MPFPIGFAARTAAILVAGWLVAVPSWAGAFSAPFDGPPSLRGSYVGTEMAASRTSRSRSSFTDQSPKAAARSTVMPPTSEGSCEEVAARQSSAYLERLKAKDHSAAREIARTTADICLEAGDFKRAAAWFQTARAVASGRSKSTAEREKDEQWRRRYQEGLWRLRPRRSTIAAAEARMAERRALDGGTDAAHRPGSAASEGVSVAPVLTGTPINQQSDWAQLPWIAVGGALGLFVLGAIVLLVRRYGAALLRRHQRRTDGRRQRRQLLAARRLR